MKQKHTKHSHIYNDKKGNKRIGKNVISDTAICAANSIWSTYLLIIVDVLLLRASLHYTSSNHNSLHLTKLFDTSLLPICHSYLHYAWAVSRMWNLTVVHYVFRLTDFQWLLTSRVDWTWQRLRTVSADNEHNVVFHRDFFGKDMLM